MNFIATYDLLETSTGWIKAQGPSIAPVNPDSFVRVLTPFGMKLYIAGAAYAGALFKLPLALPTLSGKGTAFLAFTLEPDEAVGACANVLETDVMLVGPKGEVYNFSQQLNLTEGGNEQIVNAKYAWQDVGFNPGKLAVGGMYKCQMNYAFDTTAQTSSITSMVVNGNPYGIPASMQGIPAQQLGWTPNEAVVQVQGGLAGGGGAFGWLMSGMKFEISW